MRCSISSSQSSLPGEALESSKQRAIDETAAAAACFLSTSAPHMARNQKRKRAASPADEEGDAKRDKAETSASAATAGGGAAGAGASSSDGEAAAESLRITPASQKDVGPAAKGRVMSAFEGYLTVVSGMYFNGDARASVKGKPKRDPSILPLQRRSTLGMLTSPARRERPLDEWNPRELAAFEASICAVGKNFSAIQKQVRTKSTKEIVEFFYLWKKTSHYDAWKKGYEKEYEIVEE